MPTTAEEQELDISPEEDEDEVYVEYEIATYPSDFTLYNIYTIWNDEGIIMPDFQRNYVWNIKQASLLIESFLLGLPVPPVFFYVDDREQKSLVIDGQQRIKSVVAFFDGFWGEESTQGKKKVFRLTGLDKRSPYHNKNYEELEEADKRKLSNRVLRALNIQQLQPRKDSTSVYHIFERLNTGGTPLRPQEIRNCVFRGELVNELNQINNSDAWRKIIGRSNLDKHQKDVELIVRLFALSKYSELEYEKPMKEFLNLAMKDNRDAETSGWKTFYSLFDACCQKILEALGEKPFHIRGPLNVSVLDSVFCAVINNKNKLPDDFKLRFRSLVESEDFINAAQYGTADVSSVNNRMSMASEILK